jgi:hypothetical protein
MKCIKCIKQTKHYDLDEIRRTDDQDAEEKVKSGVFKFIPKSEWKLATRKVKVNDVVESKSETGDETIAEKQLKSKKKKVKDDTGK